MYYLHQEATDTARVGVHVDETWADYFRLSIDDQGGLRAA